MAASIPVVEKFIRCNTPWSLLPDDVRASLSNSEIEYSKLVKSFSTKCQLRYKGNLVQHVYKDEKGYYKQMIDYCNENLMLYPYHLSDIMMAMRFTPFIYYSNMVKSIMSCDRSYDSLPNFTAVDCLRIQGIGRNQYIDLMNQTRVSRGSGLNKIFKKRPVNELLPRVPIEVKIEHWWVAKVGVVTEDDVKRCSDKQKGTLDFLIDHPASTAGSVDLGALKKLYTKGLVYFDVPIASDDTVSLPPLDNFVMNRTLGDEIENLIYQVFQVLDKATSMKDLATMIDTEVSVVTNIVSLMCRLGFCRKHNVVRENLDPSWGSNSKNRVLDGTIIDFDEMDTLTDLLNASSNQPLDSSPSEVQPLLRELENTDEENTGTRKEKFGFLFDSTLTAFLMMGNLTSGLKTHAVTMFEVGKLSDESMDSFISELGKISLNQEEQEGEAQRYFDHAQILHKTLQSLRNNENIITPTEGKSPGIDLLRCESLLSLEVSICQRLMQKNYSILISMAPLSQEVSPVSSIVPHHIGPFIPEMNSPWFKLFLYHKLGFGPPSLLLSRGFRLRQLPVVFQKYDKILVTCWGHDAMTVSTSNCLIMLNDALCNMPVLIQGHTHYNLFEETTPTDFHIPFPLTSEELEKQPETIKELYSKISELSGLDIVNGFGFLTCLRSDDVEDNQLSYGVNESESSNDVEISDITAGELNEYINDSFAPYISKPEETKENWVLLDISYGMPLFNQELNTAVCNTIAETDILSKQRQDLLLEANRKFSQQLLDFISSCNDGPIAPSSGGDAVVATPFSAEKHIQSRASVPLPYNSVIFDTNGGASVKLWKDF